MREPAALKPACANPSKTLYLNKAHVALAKFSVKRRHSGGQDPGFTKLRRPHNGTRAATESSRKESVASCRQAGLLEGLKVAEKRNIQLCERLQAQKGIINRLTTELRYLQSVNKQVSQEQVDRLEHEKATVSARLEAVEKKLQKERVAFSELDAVANQFEERERQLTKELTEAEQNISTLRSDYDSANLAARKLAEVKRSLETQLSTLQASFAGKQMENQSLATKISEFAAANEVLSAKVDSLSDAVADGCRAKARSELLASEIADTINEKDRVCRENSQLQTEIEHMHAAASTREELLHNLEDQKRLLQTRIDEADAKLSLKQQEIDSLSIRLRELSDDYRSQQETNVKALEAATAARDAAFSEQKHLTELLIECEDNNKQLEHKIYVLSEKEREISLMLDNQRDRYQEFKTKAEAELIEKNFDIVNLKDEVTRLEREFKKEKERGEHRDTNSADELEELKAELVRLRAVNVGLRTSRDAERKITRALQSHIHTLKGNIRVIARVRPMDVNRGPRADLTLTRQEIRITENRPSFNGKGRSTAYLYKFDRVFGSHSTNAEICEETEYLIQSALDGHNVCIFAYGQTGSGKTHTMSSQDGVNSFALRKVMAAVADSETPESQYQYQVSISCVEIYNEKLRDLLHYPPEFYKTRQLQPPASCNGDLAIKQDQGTGQPVLVGATSAIVENVAQAQLIMEIAKESRSMATTAANVQSSRSHLVFTIHLTRSSKSQKDDDPVRSLLNLVDLAGSERLTHSLATGDRLVETKAINNSLSALGNVINALMDPKSSQHIPFRCSKLTHLLQSSLSGSAKVMVVVALSPEATSIEETKSSLRFGDKASKAKLV